MSKAENGLFHEVIYKTWEQSLCSMFHSPRLSTSWIMTPPMCVSPRTRSDLSTWRSVTKMLSCQDPSPYTVLLPAPAPCAMGGGRGRWSSGPVPGLMVLCIVSPWPHSAGQPAAHDSQVPTQPPLTPRLCFVLSDISPEPQVWLYLSPQHLSLITIQTEQRVLARGQVIFVCDCLYLVTADQVQAWSLVTAHSYFCVCLSCVSCLLSLSVQEMGSLSITPPHSLWARELHSTDGHSSVWARPGCWGGQTGSRLRLRLLVLKMCLVGSESPAQCSAQPGHHRCLNNGGDTYSRHRETPL